MDELNATFDQSILQNEVSNIAILAIQQMLKNVDLFTGSRGKIDIDLYHTRSSSLQEGRSRKGLLLREINRVLATDKFLSASMVRVKEFKLENAPVTNQKDGTFIVFGRGQVLPLQRGQISYWFTLQFYFV